ncbi:Pre-mRNA-splicing factor cef1 [Actinomortierella ambigua]|nr:Pre-mRNA-splicing factor cef1 [Actinomortierella ambigua]
MRIIIKGGVWKNTEDEILKAAVSKYGKNQWARISSLLVRKTAAQCKARWNEWLDPSIKKTEWSKEEDEKLLHLAKLMPTQWRTIAPIVGRTASQCLERYQKLLDDAEQQASAELGLTGVQGGDTGPSADDVRRLRPGEIDPDPETKPARPDPVDMDEDEKEMLSEARARLANTQGKKAKRKARERQLEEARRLAALQKKRELKAAGIELQPKKKKKGVMDYNADIPFEAKPLPGFYDATEELKKQPTKKLTNQRLDQLDGKRRADVEEEERKKDAKRAKIKKESGEAQATLSRAQLKKIEEAELDSMMRRKKLVLPAPAIGEAELEEILKIGSTAEDARAMAEDSEHDATSNLVGNYKPSATLPARTPRTASTQDALMIEARNQRAMLTAQTPLLGGETPMYNHEGGTGYEGIAPKGTVAQTPNPYLAQVRQTPAHGGAGAAALRTPMRDEFSINSVRGNESVMATPRDQRLQQEAMKRQLRAGLLSLPQPKNDFKLALPEGHAAVADEQLMEEDAADVARRRKEEQEAEERARLLRRTQAVQRDLPRPTSYHTKHSQQEQDGSMTEVLDDPLMEADRLIQMEMEKLIMHDSVAYPPLGSAMAGGTRVALELDLLPDDYLSMARELVKEELEGPEAAAKFDVFKQDFEQAWDEVQTEMAKQDHHSLAAEFEEKRGVMTKMAAKAAKLEKRLGVTLGGLQARSQTLSKQLVAAHEDLGSTELELSSFQNLRIMEQAAVEQRVESLRTEVDYLGKRESELQSKWAELDRERQDVVARIETLQRMQEEKKNAK